MSSRHLIDSRPSAEQRLVAEMAQENREFSNFSAKTPLSRKMDATQAQWLLDYACDQWTSTHSSLNTWRGKMMRWEHMSEMDYSDRIGEPDPNNPMSVRDVFSFQNDTLGMSEGFVDFAAAQAKDDIFGTRPWLAATPEGRSDSVLADQITKHANWKLGGSDLECALKDGIRVACWGGTAFLKTRWDTEIDTYSVDVKVAKSKSTGQPILDPESKDFIESEERAAELELDGDDVEWADQEIEKTLTVYDNTRTSLVDFKDIAFDSKAPALDLAFTNVFCRFRMGLLDVMAKYNIPESRIEELKTAYVTSDEGSRTERGESNQTGAVAGVDEDQANPEISLIEGFMRCDPMRMGKPCRIHLIFSPELRILFRVDYLARETPDGILPVFPLRIAKIPGRILGIGYFEKYEKANNAVDRHHNGTTHRNKMSAQVISAVQPDALLDNSPRDYTLDQTKPYVLGVGKTLDDFIQFKTIPDSNERSVELMNQQLQMAQMRSGITSAAQGELKGVPSASTATGVNQLTSRGALLLKDPIVQLTTDAEAVTAFNVVLLYTHHDRDETFTWGEGETAELLTIRANDVKGLKMNVSLRLVQAQNQTKLANAQAASQALMSYLALPEMEKPAARQLFIDQITALGYNDAETIIRKAVTDPAGILALLPPEVAPIVEQALLAAGLIDPGTAPAGESSAPVTPPAGL